jgi:hypothetical protein
MSSRPNYFSHPLKVTPAVQAITDLFECLPRVLYAREKVTRIEATLAKVHTALAERRQTWAGEDGQQTRQ